MNICENALLHYTIVYEWLGYIMTSPIYGIKLEIPSPDKLENYVLVALRDPDFMTVFGRIFQEHNLEEVADQTIETYSALFNFVDEELGRSSEKRGISNPLPPSSMFITNPQEVYKIFSTAYRKWKKDYPYPPVE